MQRCKKGAITLRGKETSGDVFSDIEVNIRCTIKLGPVEWFGRLQTHQSPLLLSLAPFPPSPFSMPCTIDQIHQRRHLRVSRGGSGRWRRALTPFNVTLLAPFSVPTFAPLSPSPALRPFIAPTSRGRKNGRLQARPSFVRLQRNQFVGSHVMYECHIKAV